MRFRMLLRKRVWMPVVAVACLGIGGWVWAASDPRPIDPSELSFSAAEATGGSLHPSPYYGTRVRFMGSVGDAYRRATLEDKLVLVLHLSGRFGSSETT